MNRLRSDLLTRKMPRLRRAQRASSASKRPAEGCPPGEYQLETTRNLGDSSGYETQILAEQVRQLYALAPLGIIATLLNAAIVFLVMRDVVPYQIMIPWLAVLIFVTATRMWLILRYQREQPEPSAAPRWRSRFLSGMAVIGVAWGSLGAFPFAFSTAHQVFIAFVLGGMTAGAASTFSSVKGGYACYAIPVMLPLAVHFLLFGDEFHYAMGAMALLFLVLLWRISVHNYSVNRTSLLLRFENREMIKSLRESKEAVEGLNAQLLAEIGAKLEAEAELRAHQEHLERVVQERTADLVRANEQLKSEIRERTRVQKDLYESRERLVLAQKAGRVGVFDWDMTDDSVICTPELEELFGLSPGESVRSFAQWECRVPPEDRGDLEERIRKWTEERETDVEFEYRFLHDGGEIRWMAAAAHITYAPDGRPLRMIGTNVDITDMKEARERLSAAKDAAEAGNRAKSEFLANMSHEMRTPLAGVLGMIQLVLDMEIDAEERELLEMARRAADSLLRIIADVLDFSRMEAGIMHFDRKPFAISDVVRTAAEVVSLSAEGKGLELHWQTEGDLPKKVEGDAGRVRQVLVNLLGNAVKFTERGEITLKVRVLDTAEGASPGYLLFSIADTGVGIAAHQLERIFGKFTQIDSSLSKRYGGAGLGLALSRQIVEKMGGRIWAESTPGAGSTFFFTLPFSPHPSD